VQAEAIAHKVEYVVGMKKGIKDAAAIKFAVAFYDALGAGEDIEFAHKLACNAIQWAGLPEHLTPVLRGYSQVSQPETNICLPDLRELFNNLQSEKSLSQQFSYIFETLVKVLEMTLQLFVASTVRSYERAIVDDPPEYLKKVRPIKRIISERFTNPSLATLSRLASKCYYLIDEKAPDELQGMKEALDNTFRLGAIGQLLDDLERIVGTDDTKPRIVNKAQRTKRLFDYVIPEISKYAAKTDILRGEIQRNHSGLDLSIDVWQKALEMMVQALDPILSQVFVLECLEQEDTASGTYLMSIRTYANGVIDVSRKTISSEQMEEYESYISAVVMTRQGSQIPLRVSPFLLIKDDKLYYYKRTRAKGYEYHSIHDSSAYLERTTVKFSRRVFRSAGRGTLQSRFWAEVLPSNNEKSGVKANIRPATAETFVGRRRQLTKIRQEILEIPNQNGIVYGLGGVGKTELMIRLSHELFEEESPENVLFDNIIWVSAKSNYYIPTLDIIELQEQQLDTLNTLISTMLDFFEFDGLEEYSFEDKKELLLEVLQENRVLLAGCRRNRYECRQSCQ